ncbi:MAG TPA: GNAT family protein [Egibacteraceae bacterium]|nr:GNAT family N-acetyltransferase [Actinomycetota bacterium]HWB72713.1 GNAT family protein [Egibacteraceae bacterium]
MSERPWPPAPLQWPAEPLSDGLVTLDRVTTGDVAAIVAACNDPEAVRWLPLPVPYGDHDASEFLAAQRPEADRGVTLNFAIRRVGSPQLVGSIGAHFARARADEAELGYWVAPAARGAGVARRAIVLLARHVFRTYEPRRIELLIQPGNVASRRAATAAGAIFEGVRRAAIDLRGEPRDAAVYALLPADLAVNGEPRR